MANSSVCPKCNNNSFEVAEETPKNSKRKFNFVRCNTCGCVIGVTENYNIGYMILKLAKKLHIDLEHQ